MRFRFIAKHRGIWPVEWMCEVLDASRSGFYEWLSRAPSARARMDEALRREVRRSFSESDETYGVRRIWRDLRSWGHPCGRERTRRLVRAEGLKARELRRRWPKDEGERLASAIAPNVLERDFQASAPNQRWVADFTYIWDVRRLVVRCCRVGSVLAQDRRLVDAEDDDRSVGGRRAHDGGVAKRQSQIAATSF